MTKPTRKEILDTLRKYVDLEAEKEGKKEGLCRIAFKFALLEEMVVDLLFIMDDETISHMLQFFKNEQKWR
jgi:hypothetical protein